MAAPRLISPSSIISPLDQRRAPGQTSTEPAQHETLARLDPPIRHGPSQRYRNGGRYRVAADIEVAHHTRRLDCEQARECIEHDRARLVKNEVVDVGNPQSIAVEQSPHLKRNAAAGEREYLAPIHVDLRGRARIAAAVDRLLAQ